MLKKFDKYRENLRYDDSFVYSYDTKVALIDNNLKKLVKINWLIKVGDNEISSSPTTTKHINYAAEQLGLEVVEFDFNK